MTQLRVGVVRGGPSNEYEVSLNSGATFLRNLPTEKYIPVDILIDKQGNWHMNGFPVTHDKALRGVDVVLNGLHGTYGEDGQIQRILELFHVPYTGSGVLGSSLAMNKAIAKKRFGEVGLNMAKHVMLSSDILEQSEADYHKKLFEHFRSFPNPSVVKPVSSGSSVGVTLVRGFHELDAALRKAFEHSDSVLIEECILGKEATCGVIDHFRGQEYYALLPVEIMKPDNADFFDYAAKYGGGSKEICPGNFSAEEKRQIQEAAVAAHKALGLSHYSRSDFMVSPRRGVFILESNTLPGMTSESLLPKSLYAVGATIPEFLDHIIGLALTQKRG